jgi:hypothetical protein
MQAILSSKAITMNMNRIRNRKILNQLLLLILITIGGLTEITVARSPRGHPWNRHSIDNSSRGADGVRLADVNQDGLLDITTGWEEGNLTKIYLHPGYHPVKSPWPVITLGSTPNVEDAVFADLDQDGLTDVVSSCEGSTESIFVHWAPKDRKDYTNPKKWNSQVLPASKSVMKWMFCHPLQVDGKNGVDLIAGGKGDNAAVGWFEVPADARKLSEYSWHAVSAAGWIMSIRCADMNSDGREDILISDRKGPLRGCRWLQNPGPGPKLTQAWENHFIGSRDFEAMFLTLTDLDRDGLQDVLVAAKRSGKSEVIFSRRLDKKGESWKETAIPYPDNMGTAKAVAVGDINADKQQDLVITCENAQAPKSGVVWLSYKNSPYDTKWQPHEVSGPEGIKYDRLELLDLDGDGDLDILTCEERAHKGGLGVFWYENPLK